MNKKKKLEIFKINIRLENIEKKNNNEKFKQKKESSITINVI